MSSSLRDARSEQLQETAEARGVGGGGRGSHKPHYKALCGGFPQAFLITEVISALQIMWFLHLA